MHEGGAFSYGNIENYKSVKRFKDAISESSWKTLRFGLIAYCNFLKQDPDAIIADRNATFKADDLDTRRKHEDVYRQFIDHLKTLQSKRGGPFAPKSMDNMTIGVRAFYDQNYVKLVKPKKLEGVHPIKVTHIPTGQEELGMIVEAISHPVYRAVALAEAQSGTSISDLLALTWDKKSDTFGTIRKQVDEGVMLNGARHFVVHIHSVRQKTNVGFDSFFGSRTVEALRAKNYPLSNRVFPVQIGEVDNAISDAAKKVGIEGEVTSHMLRKFFSTQLKLARVGDDLVEYWQGHALQGSRGEYFVPPPAKQLEIYLTYEGNITPLFKGETIIQQVRPVAEAQGPIAIHDLSLPVSSPVPVVPAPSPAPIVSTPSIAPVAAPLSQPIIAQHLAVPPQSANPAPVAQSQPALVSIASAPVVMTPPPKTVLKIADLLKRLEKKQ